MLSLAVTAIGVIGSLALFWTVRHTHLRFLFARPAPFWIAPKGAASARSTLALQPAE